MPYRLECLGSVDPMAGIKDFFGSATILALALVVLGAGLAFYWGLGHFPRRRGVAGGYLVLGILMLSGCLMVHLP